MQKTIQEIAYRKYQLDWMISHGYGISDICSLATEWAYDVDRDDSSFLEWIEEYGFGGEIWACYEEFLDAEYHDETYMKHLLSQNEYERYQKEKE